ncbi:hypothetical protein RchiOBHm_Chr3g0488671 [Rosa chinensis]|uniref:Uncharacterized protein n=1 Tax=Rosa chinensis TaxID=74649 RepID=A0A2P6RFT9_ROSCH|nr:hypothetical protein RchiOBHm_Chr3g0488671 [Rosa chinensis]
MFSLESDEICENLNRIPLDMECNGGELITTAVFRHFGGYVANGLINESLQFLIVVKRVMAVSSSLWRYLDVVIYIKKHFEISKDARQFYNLSPPGEIDEACSSASGTKEAKETNSFRENLVTEPKICASVMLYFDYFPHHIVVSDEILFVNKFQTDLVE